MIWLIYNGKVIFWFFLFPILGLLFNLKLNKKTISRLLYLSILLFLPILTGYDYIIPHFYTFILFILLSCIWRFILNDFEKKRTKIILSSVITLILFVALGFILFISVMSGYKEVVNSWKIRNFKIEYTKDQGFAGGALMTYEISKYSVIPFFIKKVDQTVDDDTTNKCIIHFNEIKLDFNTCNNQLSK